MGINNLKIKPLSRAPNVKPVHKPKKPKKDKKIDPKGTIISTVRAMDVQIPNAFPIPKAFPTKGRNNGTKLSLSGDKFDASELTITNGEFKITGGTQGITVLRPEILSLFNFYPIYDNKENNTILNSHGRFLELNFQSSYLQKDSVVELIKNIEKTLEDPTSSNGNIKKQLKSINKTSSKDNLENISKILTYESDLLNTLHSIEAAFDIKNISEDSFKLNDALSLSDLFSQKMGYDKKEFQSFTNSKIYNQILLDLRGILENYSMGLLGLADVDRKKDFDPIKLDTTYTISKSNFKIAQLGDKTKTVDALDLKTFNTFQNSVPNNATNRLRIIMTLLSKEFRVSKGLGDPNISTPLSLIYATGDIGSPFENIIGVPGNNIFERSNGGSNNLANLSLVDLDPSLRLNKQFNKNMFVLPFEKKYIDYTAEKTSTYIPGSSYFVESILNTSTTNLNIDPLTFYIDKFSEDITQAQTLIKNLLGLSSDSTNLIPEKMYKQFLNTVRRSLYTATTTANILGKEPDGSSVFRLTEQVPVLTADVIVSPKTLSEASGIFLVALNKLSNKDRHLKHLLFQYYILAGIHINKTSSAPGPDLWDGISAEIHDLRNIPWFKERLDKSFEKKNPRLTPSFDLTDRSANTSVTWALEKLARAIEKRVATILLKRDKIEGGASNTVGGILKDVLSKSFNSSNDASKVKEDKEINGLSVKNNTVAKHLFNSINENGLVSSFVEFVTWIGKESNNFYVTDGSLRTRYNFLSTSSVMLLTYELYNSFIDSHMSSEFVATDKNAKLIITWDKNENVKVFSAFDDILGLRQQTTPVPSDPGNKPRTIGDLISDQISQANAIIATAQTQSIVDYYFKAPRVPTGDKKIDSIYEDIEKLTQEDYTILSMLNVLNVISNKIKDAKALAVNNFSPDRINKSLLELSYQRKKDAAGADIRTNNTSDFEYPFTFEKLKEISDAQQLKLNWHIYNTFQERFALENKSSDSNVIPVAMNIVHKDVKNTLYSYLKSVDLSEQHQSNTRVKILTVGIPSGFRDNLVDRIAFGKVTKVKKDLLIDKQIDLIKINVYKRETRYSDLIFKPQTFIFDLSMFQSPAGIIAAKPSTTDSFDKILNKIVLKNYELNNDTISPFDVSIVENDLLNSYAIKDMAIYNMLSDKQKNKLIKNHVVSYLLEVYINLLSGVKINEETFIKDTEGLLEKNGPNSNNDKLFDKEFRKLLKVYIKDVLGEDIPSGLLTSLLKNDSVSDTAKDVIKIMLSGNEFFLPGYVRAKILSPKIFERVFNLPVNIDKFELDIELTNQTNSGQQALIVARTQNMFRDEYVGIELKTYLNRRDKNDIILEDMFITIENMV